jgi:flagellin-like protein
MKINMEMKGGMIMNNKKGISAIVATVLIILITVAAVTIIWAAIIPMINNQLESGTVCLDAVSQVQLVDAGYTCVNDGDNVTLQVRHGSKDFVLKDIQVLISAGGTTTSYTIIENETRSGLTESDLPGANEEKVFTIDTTTSDIDKIQIAPVVAVGATQEVCDISATKVLTSCS